MFADIEDVPDDESRAQDGLHEAGIHQESDSQGRES